MPSNVNPPASSLRETHHGASRSAFDKKPFFLLLLLPPLLVKKKRFLSSSGSEVEETRRETKNFPLFFCFLLLSLHQRRPMSRLADQTHRQPERQTAAKLWLSGDSRTRRRRRRRRYEEGGGQEVPRDALLTFSTGTERRAFPRLARSSWTPRSH